MNEDILKAYEKAARIYCRKVTLDADEQLVDPTPTLLGVQNLRPRWNFVAIELHDMSIRLLSLREAVSEVH